jgi:hypothetical protein
VSIKRLARIKLYAGIVTAAAAIGGLGMAGVVSASPAIPAAGVAHCNVIEADGYSPCFHTPIDPGGPITINPGGPIRLA